MTLTTRLVHAVLIFVALGFSVAVAASVPEDAGFSFRRRESARDPNAEPGGTPEDVALAINKPHEYAWQLMLFLNRQALAGRAGIPDPAKPTVKDYDPDGPVVWETWANATGGNFLGPGEPNRSEVYRTRGERPSAWEALPRGKSQPKSLEPNGTNTIPRLTARLLNAKGSIQPLIDPAVRDDFEFEVRMNRSTYDTVRDQYLYSVEGLLAKFDEAKASGNRDVIQFALQSKEVKAKWIRITEDKKPRYHWRTNTVENADGTTTTELWGLSGLHIITKDLPNWFWTDFEHVDQEGQAIKDGRPSVDPTTRGENAPSGSDGVRKETLGSKWQYYRLRGVQLDFFDKLGRPTQLANTLIEPLESGPSSCITCHAKATVGASGGIGGGPVPPFVTRCLPPEFKDGKPDPAAFGTDQLVLFIQTDFLWSMPYRAHSEKEPVTVNVEMSDFKFIPARVEIQVGDSVAWINKDAVKHTATRTDSPAFDSGLLGKGDLKVIPFNQVSDAQGFKYRCTPHPFMEGVVVVRPRR